MVLGMQRVVAVLVVMLMWTVLPGCSGDGSSDPTTVSQPPTQGGPSSSPPVGGNLPPQTGTFGGGQGKILFAEGGIPPHSISEFNLTTRQVRRLVEIQDWAIEPVLGGVSRANDGTFAVVRNPFDTVSSDILHYQADGTLLHRWSVPKQRTPGTENTPNVFGLLDSPRRAFNEGGALSPDAKSIALAESTTFGKRLEVLILDVQSGSFLIGNLLGENDEPSDKSNLRASPFWSPAGELYVLSNVGLHQVDRTTAKATLVHAIALADPGAPVMSSDGRIIYFEQVSGNPSHRAIWSMDVASGRLTHRSIRSGNSDRSSLALSPDGEWLLMQEAGDVAVYISPGLGNPIGAIGLPFYVSAVRLSELPIDTRGLKTRILDVTGEPRLSQRRMVWY